MACAMREDRSVFATNTVFMRVAAQLCLIGSTSVEERRAEKNSVYERKDRRKHVINNRVKRKKTLLFCNFRIIPSNILIALICEQHNK